MTTHALYPVTMLDFETTFEADWYVSLAAPGGNPQLATVAREHPMGSPIELELRDEAWGQRHFITREPDGLLVDVVELIAPTGEFAAQYSDNARPG